MIGLHLFILLLAVVYRNAFSADLPPPSFKVPQKMATTKEDVAIGYRVIELEKNVKNHRAGDQFWMDTDHDPWIQNTFHVEPTNGTVTLIKPLDRETLDQYHLRFHVKDKDGVSGKSTMLLILVVLDVNDNYPLFTQTTFNVTEDASVGSSVFSLLAEDADVFDNGEVEYKLMKTSQMFSFDISTRVVTLSKPLDYEKMNKYTLVVNAKDKGLPSLNTTVNITINVVDLNDMKPVFQPSSYSAYLQEDIAVGTSVLAVHAKDGDTGLNSPIRYSITGGDANDFRIDAKNGTIYLSRGLDREAKYVHMVDVTATETQDNITFSSVKVFLFVSDVNDNQPMFEKSKYTLDIPESTNIGSVMMEGFKVTDADVTSQFNAFEFSLSGGGNKFGIDPEDGSLTVKGALDYENQTEYNLTVTATETKTKEKFYSACAVLVKLRNVNDNKPVFTHPTYTFHVREDTEVGTCLGTVKANDLDKGDFGVLRYHLMINQSKFSLNSTSGELCLNYSLDYESNTKYSFPVLATDAQYNTTANVSIYVSDVNDNVPMMMNVPNNLTIKENRIYTDLLHVKAMDKDSGVNSQVHFLITNSSTMVPHATISANGTLSITTPLDYEGTEVVWIELTVYDKGTPRLSTKRNVTIYVEDLNDNRPMFQQNTYFSIVLNNANVSTNVSQVVASDKDSGAMGEVSYSLIGGNEGQYFLIDRNGSIQLNKTLDGSNATLFQLKVLAKDNGTPAMNSSCKVFIQMSTSRDQARFQQATYHTTVYENQVPTNPLINVTQKLKTLEPRPLSYQLEYGNEKGLFSINSSTGVIHATQALDYEMRTVHQLLVKATFPQDTTSRVLVVVDVVDTNDNRPLFAMNNYTFKVIENADLGTILGYVLAIDADSSHPISEFAIVHYSISNTSDANGTFKIDATTGAIKTNSILDREMEGAYNLTVIAQDAGSPSLMSNVSVMISVMDVNDNAPVFEQQTYNVSVKESIEIGQSIIKVSALDSDSGVNAHVTYRLAEDNKVFNVTSNGTVVVATHLDYETVKRYTFLIIAEDGGIEKLSSRVPLSVHIDDVNDNSPRFTSRTLATAQVYEAQPVGTKVTQIFADDADSGMNAHIRYFLHPSDNTFFALNSSTGVLSTKQVLNRDTRTEYHVRVRATDNGNISRTTEKNITIHVMDWNTHAPLFVNLPRGGALNMTNYTCGGEQVFQVRARDNDTGENAKLTYQLLSGGDKRFSIDAKTGIIATSNTTCGFEVKSQYSIVIVVKDNGHPQLQSNTTLVIKIADNTTYFLRFHPDPDTHPKFYTQATREDIAVGTPLIQVTAQPIYGRVNGTISYSIKNSSSDHATINATTGLVSLKSRVDREDYDLPHDSNHSALVVLYACARMKVISTQATCVKVTIVFMDANDNYPTFSKPVYRINVSEGVMVGGHVTSLTAVDKDQGFNSLVSYRITRGNENGTFVIPNQYEGKVMLSKMLNERAIRHYKLVVMAKDHGEKSLNTTVSLTINVTAVTNHPPKFNNDTYNATVAENATVGANVSKMVAVDRDNGYAGEVVYKILQGDTDGTFTIDRETGVVKVNKTIDCREGLTYQLVIQAQDKGYPRTAKSTANLNIRIKDFNTHPPTFIKSKYTGRLLRYEKPNTTLKFDQPIRVQDGDCVITPFRYSIRNSRGEFTVDPQSGEVRSNITFNKTHSQNLTYFLLVVTDVDNKSATVNVSVMIEDKNDQAPVFEKTLLRMNITEGKTLPNVYTASARDGDLGANGDVSYQIEGGDDKFQIDPKKVTINVNGLANPTKQQSLFSKFLESKHDIICVQETKCPPELIRQWSDEWPGLSYWNAGTIHSKGNISIVKAIDREMKPFYNITIIATDNGVKPLSTRMYLMISIKDIIDDPPDFKKTLETIHVTENVRINTTVYTAHAFDRDLNDSITYRIIQTTPLRSRDFLINATSGEILVNGSLDRETITTYTLIIQATDSANIQSDLLIVLVNITDVNDNSPVFVGSYCMASYSASVTDGTVLLTVSATDKDIGVNGDIVYSITNSSLLQINPKNGKITKQGNFSSFASKMLNFTAHARDKGNTFLSTSISCTINVKPFKTNPPVFNQSRVTVNVSENVVMGTTIYTAQAFDVDFNDPVTYTFVNTSSSLYTTYFMLNKTTGCVKVNHTLDRETREEHTLFIRAVDSMGLLSSNVLRVAVQIQDVNDNRPVFTSTKCADRLDGNTTDGSVVVRVTATDSDIGHNALVRYFISPNISELLGISDSQKGAVVVKQGDLSTYIKKTLYYTITAQDNGIPPLSSIVQCSVFISDYMYTPSFNQSEYFASLDEDSGIGTTVFTMKAYDKNNDDTLSYKLFNQSQTSSVFTLNATSGVVKLNADLDRETRAKYTLDIQATDSSGLVSKQTSLVVSVTDINDNKPRFIASQCERSVHEKIPDGTSLFTLGATDSDTGRNAQLSYTLILNTSSAVRINQKSGEITKLGNFSAHVTQFINFTVVASDNGTQPLATQIVCNIYVEKFIPTVNNRPMFKKASYSFKVAENTTRGSSVAVIPATDLDTGENGVLDYFLQSTEKKFAVYKKNGTIYTMATLDRETTSSLRVQLTARDRGNPPLNSTVDITFEIVDVNDNFPVFTKTTTDHLYEFKVRENEKNAFVGKVSATDGDAGENGRVGYTITSGTPPHPDITLFTINNSTGEIYTTQRIDREKVASASLQIKAADFGDPIFSSVCTVNITIIDVNDNYPQFNAKEYKVRLDEDFGLSKQIIVVKATDVDVGRNGDIKYKITSGNADQTFKIDATSGAISLSKSLDYESTRRYLLIINAEDQGEGRLKNATTLIVTVNDVNDNPPKFQSPSSFSVYENTSIHSIIGQISARDSDQTSMFNETMFSLVDVPGDGFVYINEVNGSLYLNSLLDREAKDEYTFKVRAYNKENGTRTMSREMQVKLIVLDSNDNPPVFPPTCCNITIPENAVPEFHAYRLVTTDADIGVNAQVTYSINIGNEDGFFKIDAISGNITLIKDLNHEVKNQYELSVRATDNSPPHFNVDALLKISVQDVNEPPVLQEATINITNEDATVGHVITTFSAQDGDSNQRVTFSIASGNEGGVFTLDADDGKLLLAKQLDFETKQKHTLTIRATDDGAPPKSSQRSYIIPVRNVNDNKPSFARASVNTNVMENARMGTSVHQMQATDADNDALYYYLVGSNTDGAFALSEDGTLSTTRPLDRETQDRYEVQVEVKDSKKTISRMKRDVSSTSAISVQTVTVNIEDQNDNNPSFSQQTFVAGVHENTAVQKSVLHMKAVDLDVGPLFYNLPNNTNPLFSINEFTGWIVTTAALTGKVGESREFKVQVADRANFNGYISTANAKIYILNDENVVALTLSTDVNEVKNNQESLRSSLSRVLKLNVHVLQIAEEATSADEQASRTRRSNANQRPGERQPQSARQQDPRSTKMTFFAVNGTNDQLKTRNQVISAMQEKSSELRPVFNQWNITSLTDTSPTSKPVVRNNSDTERETLIIVVVVIACVIVICALLFVLFWRHRRRGKRRLNFSHSPAVSSADLITPSMEPINDHTTSFTFEVSSSKNNEAFDIPDYHFSDGINKPRSSKFSTFNKHDEDAQKTFNFISLLKPRDEFVEEEDENDENKRINNDKLLEAINEQEEREREKLGLKNVAFADDIDDDNKGRFVDIDDNASSITESAFSDTTIDDVITVPVYAHDKLIDSEYEGDNDNDGDNLYAVSDDNGDNPHRYVVSNLDEESLQGDHGITVVGEGITVAHDEPQYATISKMRPPPNLVHVPSNNHSDFNGAGKIV